MCNWKQLIKEGQLSLAINNLSEQIKKQPKNSDLRSYLIELLCVDAQFIKADNQLMQAIKLFPEYLSGASQIRHMVKAAQDRLDFFNGAATAHFIHCPEEQQKALIDLVIALKSDDKTSINKVARQQEQLRTKQAMQLENHICDDLRDIDDVLSGFIELFSQSGNYYLVPISSVRWLSMKPASGIMESVWQPVEFDIEGLGEGEAHMPVTYVNSHTDKEKLGMETDWQSITGDELFIGRGQKMLFTGSCAIPITKLSTVEAYSGSDVSLLS